MMLSELSQKIGGEFFGTDVKVSRFSTDTRTICKGDVFVALEGENFDGHDYLDEAFKNGASAAVVKSKVDNANYSSLIKVANPLLSYGEIAAVFSKTIKAEKIAITGSCGKTSVKEMLLAILAQKGKVSGTKGNFNNEIGVPKTLLDLEEDCDFAVIEMGANHQGEIAYLSGLVCADVVSVLNADRAHLEGFGSIDDVASAKGEIFSGAKEGASAVLLYEEKYFSFWKNLVDKAKLNLLCCSLSDDGADVYLESYCLEESGSPVEVCIKGNHFKMYVPMPGFHNIKNALIAITIAHALGLSGSEIAKGLKQARAEQGRLQILKPRNGVTLINDAYNANPLSVKAAIDVLANYECKKIMILGDMAELGKDAESLHAEVGGYAKEKKIDVLLTCGELSQSAFDAFTGDGHHFTTKELLLAQLEKYVKGEQCVCLIKGSRSSRMDWVVESFLEMEGV